MRNTFEDWRSSWLAHYGVPGMRWGVRKEELAAVGNAARSASGSSKKQLSGKFGSGTKAVGKQVSNVSDTLNRVSSNISGGGGGAIEQLEDLEKIAEELDDVPSDFAEVDKDTQKRVDGLLASLADTPYSKISR